jgi:hypothetical protein
MLMLPVNFLFKVHTPRLVPENLLGAWDETNRNGARELSHRGASKRD